MRSFSRFGWVLAVFAVAWMAGCKGDLSTPKGAAKTFATAMEKGDAATAQKASTGADPKLVASMATAMGNVKKMRDAAKSKFGASADSFGTTQGHDFSDYEQKLDDADVKEQGDTATITPKQGQPMKLKKVDGDWKVDLSEIGSGPMAQAGGGMFDAMSKAATETTDDINAGKFKTAQEAEQAFGMKMLGGAFGGLKPPTAP